MDIWDIFKIVCAVAGILLVYLYKRQIARIIEGLITDGESYHYEGKSNEELMEEIEKTFGEVL